MKRVLASILMLVWPVGAHACSVCFSATDQNRIAFLVTTIVLSLLPLAMIGGGIWWLRRRYLQLEREAFEEVERPELSARPLPSRPSS